MCGAGAEAGPSDHEDCTPCQPGTYKPPPGTPGTDAGDADFCADCPLNSIAAGAGARACDWCPRGYETLATGAAECTPCPLGHYNAAATQSDAARCTPAPAGAFVNTTAAYSYTLCAAGTFSREAASDSCDPCPPGQYANNPGSKGCKVRASLQLPACLPVTPPACGPGHSAAIRGGGQSRGGGRAATPSPKPARPAGSARRPARSPLPSTPPRLADLPGRHLFERRRLRLPLLPGRVLRAHGRLRLQPLVSGVVAPRGRCALSGCAQGSASPAALDAPPAPIPAGRHLNLPASCAAPPPQQARLLHSHAAVGDVHAVPARQAVPRHRHSRSQGLPQGLLQRSRGRAAVHPLPCKHVRGRPRLAAVHALRRRHQHARASGPVGLPGAAPRSAGRPAVVASACPHPSLRRLSIHRHRITHGTTRHACASPATRPHCSTHHPRTAPSLPHSLLLHKSRLSAPLGAPL